MIQVFSFFVGNSVSQVVIYIWVTWFNHLFQKVLQWYFEEYCRIFFCVVLMLKWGKLQAA